MNRNEGEREEKDGEEEKREARVEEKQQVLRLAL